MVTDQLAERTVLDGGVGDEAYRWEGWVNGIYVVALASNPDVNLYLKGGFVFLPGVGHIPTAALVDDTGRTYAFRTGGW